MSLTGFLVMIYFVYNKIRSTSSGKSKQRGADVKPRPPKKLENLLFFHGSNAKFDSFDETKLGKHSIIGLFGFMFTTRYKDAYKMGKYVYEVRLKINNPYVLIIESSQFETVTWSKESILNFKRDLITNGYDSIILVSLDTGLDVNDIAYIIVFYSDQISTMKIVNY
jgi:hypothetical protein